jgi:MraZ protein
MMFIGEYNHTIDVKGRIALPSKFRKDLKKGVVVTKGLNNCLWVYTKDEWEELARKLSTLPISQSKNRSFVRLMLAGAMDIDLDSQGRINLPHYLIDYGNLGKRAIVAGLYNRLEIWDEMIWKSYKRQMEKDSTKVADSLTELGI